MRSVSYGEFVLAVERVERRLRAVTAALERAGISYAVAGGNAVAAWVGRADPAATRTTRDVDLVVRRADVDRITEALHALGFHREDLRGLVLFTDPEEPSRRAGVHLVWAAERVRPEYAWAAPAVHEAVTDPAGFRVVDLPALLRMKLTSFRDIDRVHVADLLSVGLIDDSVRNDLPDSLRERLEQIEASDEL
jgi:hypothetical protein